MGLGGARDRRRLVLVGIDGFSPIWMKRFLDAGELPALGAMARDGTHVPLVSTLPATTPVAWATVATGAAPSRTGIESFLLHRPGQRLDQRVSGCYATRCEAEPIWATAARAGRRSYVVKFPLSYPSTDATFRLDGAAGWGGLKCLHEVASSSVGSTDGSRGTTRILPTFEGWAGTPPGEPLWQGRWELPALWVDAPLELHVAVMRSPGSAAPCVSIADTPSWDRVLATLAQDEFSDPLPLRARGRRGEVECRFRIKALATEPPPRSLTLLNTSVHELREHASPSAIWERHLDAAGPIEEQTEPSMLFDGRIDIGTQLDLFALNADWLTRVSSSILAGEDWDLFMIQAHFVDWAHHMFHGALDARHPDFDPGTAAAYERELLWSYRLADRLVGEIREIVGDEADIVVMGDHGQDLHHTTIHVNEWLAGQGLLRWSNETTGQVDWSATHAYGAGNFVYLNLAGREPTGVVEPARAGRTVERIVDGLLALTDPASGQRPILIAGPKRDFGPLGAAGAGVGDVVFCVRSGYQSRNSAGALFTPTRVMREFTSGHDHFWPCDRRLQTDLFAAGPHVRPGYEHPRAERLIDVAPTLAAALGIEPPRQSEGRTISEMLCDAGESVSAPAEPLPDMELAP